MEHRTGCRALMIPFMTIIMQHNRTKFLRIAFLFLRKDRYSLKHYISEYMYNLYVYS